VIGLSIDPATHGCGAALWKIQKQSGALVSMLLAAGYVPNTVDGSDLRACVSAAEAVIEWARKRLVVPCSTCNGSGNYNAPYGDGTCPSCMGTKYKPGEWIGALVIELPQVYSRGANKSKGDPNKNVLPLVMVDAALTALLSNAEVHAYQPHDWKGNTSKPETVEEEYVLTPRVKERLCSEERSRIVWPKSVKHGWDIVDAVGVFLHHAGRFKPFKRFARE
jgi:hypothetical protein